MKRVVHECLGDVGEENEAQAIIDMVSGHENRAAIAKCFVLN